MLVYVTASPPYPPCCTWNVLRVKRKLRVRVLRLSLKKVATLGVRLTCKKIKKYLLMWVDIEMPLYELSSELKVNVVSDGHAIYDLPSQASDYYIQRHCWIGTNFRSYGHQRIGTEYVICMSFLRNARLML